MVRNAMPDILYPLTRGGTKWFKRKNGGIEAKMKLLPVDCVVRLRHTGKRRYSLCETQAFRAKATSTVFDKGNIH